MTKQPTTTTSPPHSSGVVSFAPFVNVYDILHIDDYSDEEVDACWYTRKEKELIKLEIRNTEMIMAISGRTNIDSDSICTRGLEESYQTTQDEEEVDPVDDVLNAVMDEQDIQFENGIYDADKIAVICSKKAMKSQVAARMMGFADQEWMWSNLTRKEMLSIKTIVPTRPKPHKSIPTRVANVNPCRQRSFSSRAA